MKYFLFIATLVLSTAASAENPLAKLPFGVEVGKTKSKELVSRGTCASPDSTKRCSEYLMAGGRFRVVMSEDDVAAKVSFVGVADHSLPQAWKDLGLTLSLGSYGSNMIKGTSKADFLRIVRALSGVQNVAELTAYESKYQTTTKVSFDIGSHHFEAELLALSDESPYKLKGQEVGLRELHVTEGY